METGTCRNRGIFYTVKKATFEEQLESIRENHSYSLSMLHSESDVYICGLSPYASEFLSFLINIGFKGSITFVDDIAANQSFNNYPVVHFSSDLDFDSLFIITSTLYLGRIFGLLKEKTRNIVYIGSLFLDGLKLPEISWYNYDHYYTRVRTVYDNLDSYARLHDVLADGKSQRLLKNIVLFNLTYDLSYAEGMMCTESKPYLENFVCVGSDEVFIDGGGYEGDTLKDFLEVTKRNFCKYYLFEPDKEMLDKARCVSDDDRIVYAQYGLYTKNDSLKFTPTGYNNGFFSDEGMITIPVVSLDEHVNEKITMIKLDIEGLEMECLVGAIKHLVEDRPKLAISVYHKAGDVVDIYKFLDSNLTGYLYYLRVYSHSPISEIVLFAIPQNNE